jgi:hypothetical protein
LGIASGPDPEVSSAAGSAPRYGLFWNLFSGWCGLITVVFAVCYWIASVHLARLADATQIRRITDAANAVARAARTVMHRRTDKPPSQNRCRHGFPRKQTPAQTAMTPHPAMTWDVSASVPKAAKGASAAAATAMDATAARAVTDPSAMLQTWVRH